MINVTLTALLKFSKQNNIVINFDELKTVLTPIYNFEMSKFDILNIVVDAHWQLTNDPRFGIQKNGPVLLILRP